ncbi:MAG: heme lyase CcmF/NrfE family subunit [Longimicrobiales bacterium]
MTRILGYSTVAAAFALAIYGAIIAVASVRRRDASLLHSARSVAFTNFGLLTVANLAMVYALVVRDFSIDYVAQVGSRSTPLFITIISLWSSLEGSILFWGWVLALYTALAVHISARRLGALGAYATSVMLGVGAFFYLLVVGPANPFGAVFPVPVDGPGPNPLLQNHWLMGLHPPLVYFGYVGMTVPFAFAVGALLSGRLDARWLQVTRRWTVSAWICLTLAVVAGMWWSYEVLGWGGYWAWDPVENASFMPWLTATAFLHSAMVQERRPMLRVWNVSLIISSFLLAVLGTFLTRSGIVSSVHAFTQGTIGYYFVAFIGVVLLCSLALVAGRSAELRTEGSLDHALSRGSVFLVNNLLFTAFTFTVLLGTLFPVMAEAVRGVQVSVGAPFFNSMTVPLCVALLFLIGVGPMLPWRGVTREHLREKLLVPGVAMGVTFAVALAAGLREPYSLLAFGFAAFSLFGNVQEFVDGARARRRAHGEAWVRALYRLVASNNRRYGGYVAHIGLILLAVGVTASSTFRLETDATIAPGESVELAGFAVRFDRSWAREEPHRYVVGADVTAFRDGRELGPLEPRLNFYRDREEAITTPAVRSRPTGDLYITLLAVDPDGAHATVGVIVEPFVVWIWIGGLIIAAGALIGVLPVPARLARPATPVRSRERIQVAATP